MGFIMQDNTAGYVIITIISLLFFTGCISIIMSMIVEIPYIAPYKKSEEKVVLDVGLLSGIDVIISDDDSDVHAEFDEVIT